MELRGPVERYAFSSQLPARPTTKTAIGIDPYGGFVELRGFEPLTPSLRTRCATELRHSPLELPKVSTETVNAGKADQTANVTSALFVDSAATWRVTPSVFFDQLLCSGGVKIGGKHFAVKDRIAVGGTGRSSGPDVFGHRCIEFT